MRRGHLAIAVVVVVAATLGIWKCRSGGRSDDLGIRGGGDSADPSQPRNHGGRAGVDKSPASISGRVTRVTDGAGIPGAIVAVAKDHIAPMIGRRSADDDTPTVLATTDASGAWTVPAIAAGTYSIAATAAGFVPGMRTRIPVAAGSKTTVDLALAAGGAVVSGTVTDIGGGPVAGARITVTRPSRRINGDRAELVALSDAEGKYKLSLGDGEYNATATHDDYTRAFKRFELRGAPTTVDFVLAPGSSIRGMVVTRDGKPVPGAKISATNTRSLRGGSGAATSDETGGFALSGIGSGAVQLTAVAKGFATNTPVIVELGIGEHVEGVKIVVDKALSVSGRVVRAKTSDGIPNVFVGMFSIAQGTSANAQDPSDATGAFEIYGVKPGSYQLFALGDGFVPDIGKSIDVADKDVTGVIVELTTGATLSGRVDPGTVASVGLEVDLTKLGLANMMEAMKVMVVQGDADASGAFTLRAAPPGQYSIVATTTDGKRGALPITVATADQQGLIVKLEPRASIAGKVVDETGAAVAGVRVEIAEEERRGVAMRGPWSGESGTLTSADGSFKLVGLEPGKTGIVVADERGRIPWAKPNDQGKRDEPHKVELSKGQELTGVSLTVEARDGVIKGVVVNADRSPAPDAWVTVRPDFKAAGREVRRDMMMAMMSPSDPILTGADGSFTVSRLRRGTYEIGVEGAKGGSRASKSGVRTGETAMLVLEALGSITGRITLAGAPVAEFDLGCRAPMSGGMRFGGEDAMGRRFTNADGSYAIERLSPGEYTCTVTATGGTGTGKIVVATGPAKLDLALAGFATITGVAVDALDGKALPGLSVIVSAEGNEGRAFADLMAGKAPTTDANGRFTIDRVPVGKGKVHVAPKDATFNHLESRDYTATAGQRIDLGTIKLVPPKQDGGGTYGFFAAVANNAVMIVDVKSDTPADKAGVLVGDKVLSIDGRPVADLTPDVAKQLIAPGVPAIGQRVALVLDRQGTQVPVALVAEKF